MLASLLPGLRHFRTPFAVGALIALELWITLGKLMPSRKEAVGLVERLYGLAEFAGRPIVSGVLVFVLYMAGDTVRLSPDRVALFFKPKLSRASPLTLFLSSDSRWRLERYARGAFQSGRAADEVVSAAESLADAIVLEFPDIKVHLIANHIDIYMEYDRLESEAELKMNVAIYAIPLWIISFSVWEPLMPMGWVTSYLIFWRGRRALKEANALLVQALVAGIVQSRSYQEVVDSKRASDGSSSI
ncbi:hypothetical protein ACWDUG_26840 [Streptomyces cellulosae]